MRLILARLKAEPQLPTTDLRFALDSTAAYKRWYRSSLYFCATYCCPGPQALTPSFEQRFARMEFAGANRFHLGFMRYTGAWVVLYQGLSLDERLTAIRDDPWFQMA